MADTAAEHWSWAVDVLSYHIVFQDNILQQKITCMVIDMPPLPSPNVRPLFTGGLSLSRLLPECATLWVACTTGGKSITDSTFCL